MMTIDGPLGKGIPLIHGGYVHGNAQRMTAPADEHTGDGADVAEVTSPGNRNVLGLRKGIVRGIDVDPTDIPAVDGHPSVRCVGSHQPRLTHWWLSPQVAADVSSGKTQRPEAPEHEVCQILTDPSPVFKHLQNWCTDGGRLGVVFHVPVETRIQLPRSRQDGTTRQEALASVFPQLGVKGNVR